MDWKRISFLMLFVWAVAASNPGSSQAQIAQNPPAMGIPQSPSLVGNTSALAAEAQASDLPGAEVWKASD